MKRPIPVLVALFTLSSLGTGACGARSDPPLPAKQVVVWRPLGSWSGQGNTQTESFTSETGTLRVQWQTSQLGNAPPAAPGTFRLTAHSAISGRPLQQVVDQRGIGSGTDYVNQDPHVFYVVVESDHLSWRFVVDEGIAGEVSGRGR